MERLISDLLQHVSDSEALARRFSTVEGIPDVIRASILTRVLQIKDMAHLMARELETLKRRQEQKAA